MWRASGDEGEAVTKGMGERALRALAPPPGPWEKCWPLPVGAGLRAGSRSSVGAGGMGEAPPAEVRVSLPLITPQARAEAG